MSQKDKFNESELLAKIYKHIDFNKLETAEGISKEDIDNIFFRFSGFLESKEFIKKEEGSVSDSKKELYAYIDGSSINNPGDAGIGFVITEAGNKIIEEYYRYIGIKTNNEAEYEALVALLEYIIKNRIKLKKIYSDSTLMVNQISGKFKVKSENIKPLYVKAHDLIKKLEGIKLEYIERKYNLADKPAKKASELKISK